MFPLLAANKLLQERSAQARARVTPELERVDMTLGGGIYEPAVALTHRYFPTDCIISMLYLMQNGAYAEISVVGSEGALRTSRLMGGGSTSSRAAVQRGRPTACLRREC